MNMIIIIEKAKVSKNFFFLIKISQKYRFVNIQIYVYGSSAL